jgi:hypothetical protein
MLLSVAWWDIQQGIYSQVGVAFFSPLFLFLTRRLTALLACFLCKKMMHSFFGLSMKGASSLNS